MLVVKPHISTNSLRLVEELVGKLPTWLLPINNDLHGRAPAEFHQHIQRAPIHSQQQSMFSIGYDQSHMPPLEYAPSNMPLREHTPASMPNLQFAPPTVKAGINTSSKTQVVQERDDGNELFKMYLIETSTLNLLEEWLIVYFLPIFWDLFKDFFARLLMTPHS